MWPQDGQPSSSSSVALPSGLPASARTTNAQPESQPNATPSKPASNQPDKSLRSAVWWLRRMREIGERKTPGAALRLRRLSLIALSLPILATCSPAKLWQQDPTVPVKPCPIVQCLDRALRMCEGVTPPDNGVRNCQDAVLLASDALGEIMVCQQAHAALIQCVEDFNASQKN